MFFFLGHGLDCDRSDAKAKERVNPDSIKKKHNDTFSAVSGDSGSVRALNLCDSASYIAREQIETGCPRPLAIIIASPAKRHVGGTKARYASCSSDRHDRQTPDENACAVIQLRKSSRKSSAKLQFNMKDFNAPLEVVRRRTCHRTQKLFNRFPFSAALLAIKLCVYIKKRSKPHVTRLVKPSHRTLVKALHLNNIV